MILGIDPGLANTGFAVLEKTENKEQKTNIDYELVAAGVMKTKLDGDNSADRLGKIYKEMEEIIKKYKVTEVAYETLFFAKNTSSAIKVAEAIGVIKLCGHKCGLEVFGYTPLQVKIALTGYGRADKDQLEMMVRTMLGLKEGIGPSHASDAVAVALTHAGTMRV